MLLKNCCLLLQRLNTFSHAITLFIIKYNKDVLFYDLQSTSNIKCMYVKNINFQEI